MGRQCAVKSGYSTENVLAIILRVFSFTRMSADLNAVSLEIRERFFDAPDWLMNPEEGKNYSTPANRQLMESLGAQIFDYSTAPNIVELK